MTRVQAMTRKIAGTEAREWVCAPGIRISDGKCSGLRPEPCELIRIPLDNLMWGEQLSEDEIARMLDSGAGAPIHRWNRER